VTRLMLESELYQLTAVGGPRYLPRSVNSAAFRALVPALPMPLPDDANHNEGLKGLRTSSEPMRIVPIAVQDQLFPRGQWSRRLISWVARIIHPTEVG
jgi:hypothetical protein